MTATLERAFEKASRLSAQEQDAVGEWLLCELESEACWRKLLSKSQDALGKLAAEALEEHDGKRGSQP